MTRAVGDASRIRGCLRGAMHVCKTADGRAIREPSNLNMRDDLDTTKVQRNGGDGEDANETRWQSERQNERMRHVVAILSSPRVPSLQRISCFCFVYLSAPPLWLHHANDLFITPCRLVLFYKVYSQHLLIQRVRFMSLVGKPHCALHSF